MTLFRETTSNSSRMEDAPENDSWSHRFEHYGPKLLLCVSGGVNVLG